MLKDDNRRAAIFKRMAERSGITHRYSFLEPGTEDATVDAQGFYRLGAFPDTAARMKMFEACAPGLAVEAVEKLLQGEDRSRITHVIVMLAAHGFLARDPAIQIRIAFQQQSLIPVQQLCRKAGQMRIGKTAEQKVHFACAAVPAAKPQPFAAFIRGRGLGVRDQGSGFLFCVE